MRKVALVALVLVAAACSSAIEADAPDRDPASVGVTEQPQAQTPQAEMDVASPLASPLPPIASDGYDNSGISVSGVGRIAGVPDTLVLTIGVSLSRRTVAEAVDAAAQLADGVITELKGSGVADKDIQTSDFSIWPDYDSRGERITGYQVSNMLTIKIRDIDRAGEIIDKAATAGGNATRIHGVRFALEENAELVTQAREAAWNDALAKAEQLASLAGISLGVPISIVETSTPAPQQIGLRGTLAAEADFYSPIESGEVSLQVALQVRFAVGG